MWHALNSIVIIVVLVLGSYQLGKLTYARLKEMFLWMKKKFLAWSEHR